MKKTILVILPEKDHESIRIQFEAHLLEFNFSVQFIHVDKALDYTEVDWKSISVLVDCDGKKMLSPEFAYLMKVHANSIPPLLAIGEFPISYEYQDALLHYQSDILLRPFSSDELCLRLNQLCTRKKTTNEYNQRQKTTLLKIVGEDSVFKKEIEKIPLIASCDSVTLIEGETGTGKELFARAIHILSERCDKPFIPINCGAIPVDLIENELFGHQKEAFTGADSVRKGLIYEANGGTLFFDEIDALPLVAQSKLLRFLQEKEYRPLGSSKSISADVRFIAASNRNLAKLVANSTFRGDLFYRINVLKLTLPPLRERQQDILLLFNLFLLKHSKNSGLKSPGISLSTHKLLLQHDWPGNVRELENAAERALVYCKGKMIEPYHLNLHNTTSSPDYSLESFKEAKNSMVKNFERNYLVDLLVYNKGNISQAAKSAGKNRRAFWELMRKHKIEKKSLVLETVDQ